MKARCIHHPSCTIIVQVKLPLLLTWFEGVLKILLVAFPSQRIGMSAFICGILHNGVLGNLGTSKMNGKFRACAKNLVEIFAKF